MGKRFGDDDIINQAAMLFMWCARHPGGKYIGGSQIGGLKAAMLFMGCERQPREMLGGPWGPWEGA